MGRILGLDVGQRRIGVALSDPEGLLASALAVMDRTGLEEDTFRRIAELAQEHEAQGIVVGLPRSMDGSMGPEARRVQSFVEGLSRHTELRVETWDERLSTVAAAKALAEAGLRGAKRRKRLDAAAAALVLQSYLDWRRRGSP